MIVDLTYSCRMNCPHCMSSCVESGQHMSVETLKDVLAFLIKNEVPLWAFTGGEPFENPSIVEMLGIIGSCYVSSKQNLPITFCTNGRQLARSKDAYDALAGLQKLIGKRNVLIQVTDDPNFYHDKLSDKEKYWLLKLGASIEPVPSRSNSGLGLYPQGRALENYGEKDWQTNGPKCANCVLVAKQMDVQTIKSLSYSLASLGKMCSPAIAPDGSIKLGESALCPACASIYDNPDRIVKSIKSWKCAACKYPWQRLKETNPQAYRVLMQ